MGYHVSMSVLPPFRVLSLVVLLAISNLAFAFHATTHFGNPAPSCEWCVCQGQSPAGPLPESLPDLELPPAVPAFTQSEFAVTAKPQGDRYRSRAPPTFI